MAAERSSRESEQALAELCQQYWIPIYAYVRSRVGDPHQAEDLTQTFFARLLEKRVLQSADPSKGRFRAFLLTAVKRLMANEWDKQIARKRGGSISVLPLDFEDAERQIQFQENSTLTPEQLFTRSWVRALLQQVMEQLEGEYESAGKGEQFLHLKPFITVGQPDAAMSDLANRLKISADAARVAVHRLRRRYRQRLRSEVAKTVRDANEIEEEIRELFAAFE